MGKPKKLRNAPVTILTEILKEKAKLNNNLERINNQCLGSFHQTFIAEMKKQDDLFNLLYQFTYYTGSYYSNLRISEPNEYDLNLLLKIPCEAQNISVKFQPQVPSYVEYRITDETIKRRADGLDKLFDENGFLIPDKVRSWFQGVVDKALDTYKYPKKIAQVETSSSKPARTIILVKNDGTKIDIDLVPVIECSINEKPPEIDVRVFEKFSRSLQQENITGNVSGKKTHRHRPVVLRTRRLAVRCFLVPKAFNPSEQAPVNGAECSRLWRAHYPKAEEDVMFARGCAKSVIRLLKLLRDIEDWKILASYYLKTVVMWMILENPNNESWNTRYFGKKFLQALKNLQSYVERREIPYFFSSGCNLLEKLDADQASNIKNRLSTIIRDIESDVNNLWDVFDCTETFQYVLVDSLKNDLRY